MITNSERDDFQQAIRNKGLDSGDFELIESRDTQRGAEIHLIRGEVTIRRVSRGVERLYRTGRGSTWTAHFYDDLKAGLFD